MDLSILYNVEHEVPLRFPIAIYFYLTGLSAGSFIMSTLAYGFGLTKYKPLGKIGVIMAVLLLVIAPLNLMIDLEQPFRFWHLFFYLNFSSPISWGSFLLMLYPLNCTVYGYFMFKGDLKRTKLFGFIGIPLALAVHGYTGFILALAKGRILWNTALMPPLFLMSAMVSGIALMILVVTVIEAFFLEERFKNRALIFDLGNFLVVSIVIDIALIATDILVLLTSHTEAYEAAMMLLKGSFSYLFVGVELFMGSLIPLFLLLFPKTRNSIPAIVIASILVMIGIMAMRYILVIGGQTVPLS